MLQLSLMGGKRHLIVSNSQKQCEKWSWGLEAAQELAMDSKCDQAKATYLITGLIIDLTIGCVGCYQLIHQLL